MNKPATGGLAIAAAAGLLLVAGSMAHATPDGQHIDSGHPVLDSTGCTGWRLDDGAVRSAPAVVPGDTLTKTCTYTVSMAAGATATFDVSRPRWTRTNRLTAQLKTSVTLRVDDVARTIPTVVAGGDVVTVVVAVRFPDNAEAAGLHARLDELTVTATQNVGS